jgi:hypothetical protein
MGTISKILLSNSTQGEPIQITATGSPISFGTTIHVTDSSSNTIDEIWLYATNNDSVPINLTVQFGQIGTYSEISASIAAKTALYLISPGLILKGNGSFGATVSAYASNTNSISIVGYINRIIP